MPAVPRPCSSCECHRLTTRVSQLREVAKVFRQRQDDRLLLQALQR